MRSAGQRRSGLAQGNEAADTSLQEVQLRDHGSIPERDEASRSVACDHRRIRKRGRDVLERREIEAVNYFAVPGIQQQRFIRTVAGHQQTLFPAAHTQAQAARIGNVAKFRAANFSTGDLVAGRQSHESLRSNPPVLEGIYSDTVTRAALLLAQRIGERSHGSIEVFAVAAEGQAKEIRLPGLAAEAIVRRVGKLVAFQIKNGERLFHSRRVGAEPAVQEHGKAAIGRERDSGGKIIGWPRISGNLREKLAVRQLRAVWRILRNKRRRQDQREHKK